MVELQELIGIESEKTEKLIYPSGDDYAYIYYTIEDTRITGIMLDVEHYDRDVMYGIEPKELEELPYCLFKLEELKELIVIGHPINKLSSEINKLTNLKAITIHSKIELIFHETLIKIIDQKIPVIDIPHEFGDLQALEYVNIKFLDKNSLSTICRLSQLQQLTINEYQSETLSAEITSLQHLTDLKINGSKLTRLPHEIDQLENLENLSLISNSLFSLPETIGKLNNLKSLELSRNNLNKLPTSLSQLTNLDVLRLYANKIEIFPTSILSLINLKVLDISHNEITELPENIGNLKSLKKLYTYNKSLTSFPDTIATLSSLEEIYAHPDSFSSSSVFFYDNFISIPEKKNSLYRKGSEAAKKAQENYKLSLEHRKRYSKTKLGMYFIDHKKKESTDDDRNYYQ
ncbi:MAG: leucine-rich repeat domain-containing protein [Candidatus Heimdallarchaeota archaeon]|nr:leucine-rich repeat domain-containing protein [Candidatus Heimdallarchaeota archaeon]